MADLWLQKYTNGDFSVHTAKEDIDQVIGSREGEALFIPRTSATGWFGHHDAIANIAKGPGRRAWLYDLLEIQQKYLQHQYDSYIKHLKSSPDLPSFWIRESSGGAMVFSSWESAESTAGSSPLGPTMEIRLKEEASPLEQEIHKDICGAVNLRPEWKSRFSTRAREYIDARVAERGVVSNSNRKNMAEALWIVRHHSDDSGYGFSLHRTPETIEEIQESLDCELADEPIELTHPTATMLEALLADEAGWVWDDELIKSDCRAVENAIDSYKKGTRMKDKEGPPRTRGELLKDQSVEVGKAVVRGLGNVALDQAGDAILDVAQKFAPKAPWLQAMLADDIGREVIKALGAVFLQTMTYQTGAVPHPEIVRRVCAKQLERSTEKVVGPFASDIRKLATAFVLAGKEMGEDEEIRALTADTPESVRTNNSRRAAIPKS